MDEITKKLLFHEYILKKFGNAVEEEKEKRSLAYEVEYLLEGKTSDQENLEAVLNKLLLIRMGLNLYICRRIQQNRRRQELWHWRLQRQ